MALTRSWTRSTPCEIHRRMAEILRKLAALCVLSFAFGSAVTELRAADSWIIIVPDVAWNEEARRIGDVLVRSGGAKSADVYERHSLAGTWEAAFELLKADGAQMAVLPADLLARQAPPFGILNLPFALESVENARRFLSGPAAQLLKVAAAQMDLVVLAATFNPRVLASIIDCDPSVEAILGRKIRATDEVVVRLLQSAGAAIWAAPFAEVYAALQAGAVDGVALPVDLHIAYRIPELARCIASPQPAALSLGASLLVVRAGRWESLSEGARTALLAAAKGIENWNDARLAAANSALETQTEIMRIETDDLLIWRRLAQESVHAEFAQSAGNDGMRLLELAHQ